MCISELQNGLFQNKFVLFLFKFTMSILLRRLKVFKRSDKSNKSPGWNLDVVFLANNFLFVIRTK
jgi:hypothetical protein